MILQILILMPLFSLAQKNQFVCPIAKGKIVIEERGISGGKRNPGAIFEGKDSKVYSCSSGSVKGIDTAGEVKRIHIEFEEYFFSYNNLASVNVTTGQLIMKGELIGEVKESERLFLICSKDNILIEPQSILKCKIVHRYIN